MFFCVARGGWEGGCCHRWASNVYWRLSVVTAFLGCWGLGCFLNIEVCTCRAVRDTVSVWLQSIVSTRKWTLLTCAMRMPGDYACIGCDGSVTLDC
jgi:hypothetical protein